MTTNDIAVIGMNAMGQSLALNIRSKKYNIAVYDEDFDTALSFANDSVSCIKPYKDIKSLFNSLAVPKKIFLCINAEMVEEVILQMMPHFTKGDTIIDLSNSYYLDSVKRAKELKYKLIRYLDVGLTGAADELSKGAGLIVGGEDDAFGACSRILRQISKEHKGYSCCIHSGACGTGHFSKIVHDCIEHSLMQIIADGYFCLRNFGQMTCEEISAAFNFMNEELNSYLIDITAQILMQNDEDTGKPIIDLIMDAATQSRMGNTAVHEALKIGVPLSIMSQSVFFRYLSCQREERRVSSKKLSAPVKKFDGNNVKLIDNIKDAVKSSMIIAYAQGFDLLNKVVQSDDWAYGEDEISRIWCGSSTIESYILDKAQNAYNKNEYLLNIMHDEFFAKTLKNAQKGWREVVCLAAKHCIPASTFMSSLSYYDAIRSNILPANLIQAQRNYLGRDTVKRYDVQGDFDIEWFQRT